MTNIIQFRRKKVYRGIVAPSGIMAIKGNNLFLERTYIPEDIFYYVMYWDKIAIPTSSIIHMGLPLEKELKSLGILERPSLPATGTVEAARHVHWTFGEVAKQKLKDDDFDWIIHHMSGDPIYLPEHSAKKDTLRLKITNALPIPSSDGKFSLDDLLEFKNRRASELEGLHTTMDRLLKKLNHEELDVIRKTELKRFENAILELDRTVFERFKIMKKSDFEVNIDLTGDAIQALILNTPALIHDIKSNGIPLATIATSILSMFSLSKKYGVTLNQYNHGDFNLEYISSARSENIIF
ncbi:DUF6236 family protein [Acinetobacter baumannii]|nr:hypothetical protein [Acinetobacter baumannii]MDV7661941.1 DUF6236 family protein [Acinetobacter baumannii]HDJ7835377.1 hypothetical protein [Acinetobacter baumannii]